MDHKKFWRQGDVILTPCADLPNDIMPEDTRVIAYGEVTGHAHRLTDSPHTALYQHPATQRRFLRVIHGGLGNITHEEHADVDVPEGDYEIKIQREYDDLLEQIRRVAD